MKDNNLENTEKQDNIGITVCVIGEKTEQIKFEHGMTVVEVLRRIETKIKLTKVEISVNGSIAALTTLVNGGDKIVVTPILSY